MARTRTAKVLAQSSVEVDARRIGLDASDAADSRLLGD
jgi:hypothetical protein